MSQKNKHQYSKEILYHFRCAQCGSWWSIGDFQIIQKPALFCPHCGTKAALEELKPKDI